MCATEAGMRQCVDSNVAEPHFRVSQMVWSPFMTSKPAMGESTENNQSRQKPYAERRPFQIMQSTHSH